MFAHSGSSFPVLPAVPKTQMAFLSLVIIKNRCKMWFKKNRESLNHFKVKKQKYYDWMEN